MPLFSCPLETFNINFNYIYFFTSIYLYGVFTVITSVNSADDVGNFFEKYAERHTLANSDTYFLCCPPFFPLKIA
jgi:hypothetical protein